MAHYTEMFGYPKELYGENGQFFGERKLKCAWADRKDVLLEVAGNGGQIWPYYVVPGGSEMPGKQMEARAMGASIIPFGKQTDLSESPIAVYDQAIITVKYSTTTAIKLSDVWVTEELTPTAQLINVNTDKAEWTSGDGNGDPVLPSDNIVKVVPSFDYVVTYEHLGGIPAAAYTEVGKVNSLPVASWLLGLSFDAETLLHTRPVVRRSFDPALINTFRLVYRFSFVSHTWNKHWHIDSYETMDIDPIYESFNFLSLVP